MQRGFSHLQQIFILLIPSNDVFSIRKRERAGLNSPLWAAEQANSQLLHPVHRDSSTLIFKDITSAYKRQIVLHFQTFQQDFLNTATFVPTSERI